MRHVNLLFQGGGVKGIAYAGVLAEIPPDCRVEAVAGTSAGAIAAAFVALGYPADRLKELLSDDKLFGFLSAVERERARRIDSAWADLSQILNAAGGEPKLTAWQLMRLARKHRRAIRDVLAVWRDRGLHSTNDLREWLDKHLRITKGPKKGDRAYFDDIQLDDLRIVVADVTNRQFKVFERRRHGGVLIANAVHASISIPIFFIPFLEGGGTELFVDGGILSNYPSFLFAQSIYKTIGFRFSDAHRPARVGSTMEYLAGLVFTMTDAHDKLRGDPPRFISYEIPTDIPATKFHLTRDEAENLYKMGSTVGKSVDWKAYSSELPEIAFYDERPQDVLQSSLAHAFALMDKYGKDINFWVDSLDVVATYSVRIEEDGTVRYGIRETLTVGGARPLFFSRLRANWSRDVSFGKSLADLQYFIREVRDGAEIDVIRVPALNKESSKGFLVFFTPPVTSDRPREFHTEFSVPQEVARTLLKGKGDTFSYASLQISPRHRLTLTFQVLADVAVRLPDCRVGATFKDAERVDVSDVQGEGANVRRYSGWEWRIPQMAVVNDVTFQVEVGAA